MKGKLVRVMFTAMLAGGAAAQGPADQCKSALAFNEVSAAMGAGVSIQPVFQRGTHAVKGWRVYNVRRSPQLMSQGIGDGAMITHVCGVPAGEISAKGLVFCCPMDAASDIEVTFELDEGARKVRIKRPA